MCQRRYYYLRTKIKWAHKDKRHSHQKAYDLVEEGDTHTLSGMRTSTDINNNYDALRAVNFSKNFQKMHIKKFLVLVETI